LDKNLMQFFVIVSAVIVGGIVLTKLEISKQKEL
jgi:hypothetical protein